uniref:NADH-ubiquinone oxidoreductase chain 2 n=1 Tax=Xylosandrus crassiusculus TaxID=124033 RepID=A0A343A693_9CUCU|nr:NADH dehydrogenase subunit 2 [Xylosandrus crassiusculus]AOY40072.1 NADH dehydrogenase subunit 2 [Xylosandrus crassiusculus]
MFKFFKLLFFSTLITGSLISISSLSWFSTWIGLEINLLSFIPLMKTPSNKYSSESISKYFMTQAMASFILLFSIIMFTNSKVFNMDLTNLTSILMSSAIFMKMGAAPLHFWFPEVASGISWNSNLILLTWQKLAPMIILSYMSLMPSLMIMFILSSSIIGSLLGLNQTCMRKILAYSSINHISWMVSSLMCSINTFLIYFTIYSFMNLVIINNLKMWKISFMSQINMMKNNPQKLVFVMNLFSLGGLPPFVGFIPKWMTINQLSNNSMFFLTTMLIIFTLITLFFYLRISFSSLTLYTNNTIFNLNKNNIYQSIILLLSTPIIVIMSSMMT